MIRRAILLAREVGPTYVQVLTPCPTNYKFKNNDTITRIKKLEKDGLFKQREYITPQAQEMLDKLEGGSK